jgi:hypothetical protein
VWASRERKWGIVTHSGYPPGPSWKFGRVATSSSITGTVSDRINVKRWERWRRAAGPRVPGVLDTSMRLFSIVREWYSKLLAKGSQDLQTSAKALSIFRSSLRRGSSQVSFIILSTSSSGRAGTLPDELGTVSGYVHQRKTCRSRFNGDCRECDDCLTYVDICGLTSQPAPERDHRVDGSPLVFCACSG